jgi:hypothetical protein
VRSVDVLDSNVYSFYTLSVLLHNQPEMTTQETEKQIAMRALDEAVAIMKEKGLRLWRELGVTRGALSQWRRKDREIPSRHCKKIFVLTDERVACDRLNPKVFGDPHRPH